jgi:thiol-disulfide isomerase/thioredoxin
MQHLAVRATLVFGLLILSGCEVGYEQPSGSTAKRQESNDGWRPTRQVRDQAGGVTRLAGGHMQFIAGYRQGCLLAAREQKPMMLFFTASWCKYCHQMADEAFTHPQVVRLSDSFVCVLVDVDREPDTCRQFEVAGYPTIQFLSPRGVPLERIVGKKAAPQVLMAMQAALGHAARKAEASAAPTR